MRLWRLFLAYFRLSEAAVCELSTDEREFHDYPDSTVGEPWHFYVHTCRRCGRGFTI